jgi:riboflavin transporter 2
LIFFWSYTTIIGNEKRSTALLILAFFLSLLDCTSSISFADYIQRFRKEFTSTMFLGESLTSILPSLLAIVQGNGQLRCIQSTNGTNTTEAIYETARFSVSIYFLCLFILLTISFIAFVLLQWTSITQNARQIIPETSLETTNTIDKSGQSLTTSSYILLSLGCTYTSSILFGMILSISTFVLMPYGHRIFYLGTILSPWMFTLVWILGMIKPLLSKRYLLILILLGSITFAFDLFVSFKSPCPPWVDTTKGSVLILIVWLSTYVLLGYPRLVIANYVRIHSPNGMFWYGVNVQLGALIGSIVAYLLVETFSVFRERIPCEQITC